MNESFFDIAYRNHALYTHNNGVPDNFYTYYPIFFDAKRNSASNVLEIGIFNGTSLQCWKEYFSNAQIVGLDKIDCKQYESERICIYQGDQSDKKLLLEIAKIHGKFDIVIDDASRDFRKQLITFDTLFPFVESRGLYIILGTSTSWNCGQLYPGCLTKRLHRYIHDIQLNQAEQISSMFTAMNFTLIQKC